MFVEFPKFTTVATERLSSIMSWIAPLNFPAKLRVSGESSGPPCLGFTAEKAPRGFWTKINLYIADQSKGKSADVF